MPPEAGKLRKLAREYVTHATVGFRKLRELIIMTQQTARPLKVGLFLPMEERAGNETRWRNLKKIAQHAEAVGFDSLWLCDHLLYDFGKMVGMSDVPPWGMWECWSMLSSVAAVTTRVDVGAFVACTSFRNPTLLAKMADTVDEISGGRLILGLGAGYDETEFRAFGYPFDHRVGRFEEAVQIIRTLLRTGEIDFHGEYYDAERCELRPRGPRSDGPPILIGARQSRMIGLAAQYADYFNSFGVNEVEKLVAARESVDAACMKVGRDPRSLKRTSLMILDLPGGYTGPHADVLRRLRSGWASLPLGRPEDFADLLRAFAREGVSLVHIWPEPNTLSTIDALAPVLELLDRQ
jgi:alkanesulfonate monooxygenase SsuD/methylene tetrahydromethanopterin reductase-like flavin-dependent oxidoreductase (luciferase family)